MTRSLPHRPARSSRSTRALLAGLPLAIVLAGCADGGLQPTAPALSRTAPPCGHLAGVPPTALAHAPGLAPCRNLIVSGNVLVVNGAATGASNGSRWADAYTDLQSALAAATAGQEIWVAAGTYTPSSTGDRATSFALKSGVGIYGGFAGTESQRTERDWRTHVTVLSGDLHGDDGANFANNGENSYHVVTGGGADTTAVLDGVTISGGNANGSSSANAGGGMYNESGSPTLMNVTISGNTARFGGGMLNRTSVPPAPFSPSSPVLTNVTISGNTADSYGGGMYNTAAARPVLTNVSISGNTTVYGGGGMYNDEGSPTLTNVTISGNTARLGGGMYNTNLSSPQIRNSILWGNDGGELFINGAFSPANVNVSYSTVRYGCPSRYATCDHLSSTDPLFTNPVGGDYTLQAGSPAVDAGNNSFIPSGVTTDFAGNARIGNGAVDHGAYERQFAKLGATVTLGPLARLADGTATAVTATTSPANLPVVVTYDGKSTVPSAPGSYAVVATVDSPAYQGSATGTLVLSAAKVTVQPATISLSLTNTVTVTVYGSALLDAAALDPAVLRVRVGGGRRTGAPVAQRSGSYSAALRDVDADGRMDRVLTVNRTDLVAAGLSTSTPQMLVEHLPAVGLRFQAAPATAPTVAP